MDVCFSNLIYFSPTHTTKRIVEAVSDGIQLPLAARIDLTPSTPSAAIPLEAGKGMAIIGAPVYSGRLPVEMVARFRRLTGAGAPAVILVTYGNRAYEDALLELRDVALEAGFNPVAAGAFIGEHSYATAATPVAVGRPDDADLHRAKAFGEKIRGKMESTDSLAGLPPLRVPGEHPYKERRVLPDIAPVSQASLCTRCGRCAPVCPTAAIAIGETVTTESRLCIRCCACVKACPSGARTMADGRIREMAERLATTCSERKEPETFL